jgi:hypothetical protein
MVTHMSARAVMALSEPFPLSLHQAAADGRERSSDFKRAAEGVLLL